MTLKKSIFLFLLLILTAACQQPPKKEEASQSEPDNKSDKVLDYFKSRQPTKEQLMAEAKKRNIPFRKEENGVIYELHSFDEHSGMPIYYTTKDIQGQSQKVSVEERK